MKKFLIAAIVTLLYFSCEAQNRWNVHVGGSVSHLCEKAYGSTDTSYGWGGGAFIGGGYEINFNNHWSLTPQLELSYNDNGATLSSKELDFSSKHSNWLSTWSLNVPIIASYRFSVSDNMKLRFGAGPYLQEVLAARSYNADNVKEGLSGSFNKRFNVGIVGEAAIETGSHISYMLRAQYPFLKEGWVRKTLVLSVGVGYSF